MAGINLYDGVTLIRHFAHMRRGINFLGDLVALALVAGLEIDFLGRSMDLMLTRGDCHRGQELVLGRSTESMLALGDGHRAQEFLQLLINYNYIHLSNNDNDNYISKSYAYIWYIAVILPNTIQVH